MSMDQNLQQKEESLRRPFNNLHIPDTESDPSSDEEPVQCEAVPVKVGEIVPDQAGEMVPLKSGEIVTYKAGETVTVKSREVSTKSVQVKTRRCKTKATIKEKSGSGVSAAMADLKKFSKSLIKDFKVQTNKMLSNMTRDLRKLKAGNSTKRTADNITKRTRNKGKSTLKKRTQTQEQEKTPSEVHLEQNRNSASSSNCIVPAVAAYSTALHDARTSSATHVIIRQGFDFSVQAPLTNFVQTRSRDFIIQTAVRSAEFPPSLFPSLDRQIVAGRGSGIPLPPSQGLGNTRNIGAATFPGSGLASTSIGANTFPINVNSIGNVALIRLLESQCGHNR